MERPQKPPPLGDNDVVMIGLVRKGFLAMFSQELVPPVDGKQFKNETILAEGATRRKAYYRLMKETQHWPQAARDALYIMLYPDNIALEPGECDNSLGMYKAPHAASHREL